MGKRCSVCQGHGELFLVSENRLLLCWACKGTGLADYALRAY